MRWLCNLMILRELLQGQFGSWFIGAVGTLAAVVLHWKDKKCRLWPALAAVVLWLACDFTGINVHSYAVELLALFIGFFAIGYAAGWLVMDVVYLVKSRKKEQY